MCCVKLHSLFYVGENVNEKIVFLFLNENVCDVCGEKEYMHNRIKNVKLCTIEEPSLKRNKQ